MPQPHETELDTQDDDWGDFGAVISQLEQQEQTESVTESNALETEAKPDHAEAITGLLNVIFLVTEKATSVVAGVEFEFDEKGKQEVLVAAVPVLNKHGGIMAGWVGDYIEEATLLLAVLGLVYASRESLKTLKAEKAREEKRRAEHGKETGAAEAA